MCVRVCVGRVDNGTKVVKLRVSLTGGGELALVVKDRKTCDGIKELLVAYVNGVSPKSRQMLVDEEVARGEV